jgi:hypothetical protein
MKRVVILGASGFFGRLIAERLRAAGVQPVLASRSRSEVRIDANDREQIRTNLKARDLVIDAAGPFQTRTTALIEAARTIGFDIIDLSDSPEYTSKIYELEAPIRSAGIRVLTACSALSTVSAAVLKSIGMTEPRRVSAYLVPASRYTANPATTQSMLTSLIGKARTIRFPRPLGTRSGVTVKSVDAVTLPRVFRSIRTTELIVDTHVPGANALLKLSALWPGLRRMLEQNQPTAIQIARRIGPKVGVLAYEISAPLMQKYVIFTGEKSYLLAVLPAVQAAIAIANGRFSPRGVVPPTEHVDSSQLFEAVRAEGITAMA